MIFILLTSEGFLHPEVHLDIFDCDSRQVWNASNVTPPPSPTQPGQGGNAGLSTQ